MVLQSRGLEECLYKHPRSNHLNAAESGSVQEMPVPTYEHVGVQDNLHRFRRTSATVAAMSERFRPDALA